MCEQNGSVEKLIQRDSLKILGLHPNYVNFDSENLNHFERTRHLHHKPEEFIKHRYEGEGTRTKLQKLLVQHTN